MGAGQTFGGIKPDVAQLVFPSDFPEKLHPILRTEVHVESMVGRHAECGGGLINTEEECPVVVRLEFEAAAPGRAPDAIPESVVAEDGRVSVNAADVEGEHVERGKVLPDVEASDFRGDFFVHQPLLVIHLVERDGGQGVDITDVEVVADVFAREVGAGGVGHAKDQVAAGNAEKFFQLRDHDELKESAVGEALAAASDRIAEEVGGEGAAEIKSVVVQFLAVGEDAVEGAVALHPRGPAVGSRGLGVDRGRGKEGGKNRERGEVVHIRRGRAGCARAGFLRFRRVDGKRHSFEPSLPVACAVARKPVCLSGPDDFN